MHSPFPQDLQLSHLENSIGWFLIAIAEASNRPFFNPKMSFGTMNNNSFFACDAQDPGKI
jgi:hypothetical protein